jgi:hypothetical protein
MTRARVEFGLLALLLVGLAGNAAAERQATPSEKWARVTQVAPGTEIRVTLVGGRTIRGYLQKATADSVAVNATTSQEMLLRAEITRVQLRHESHRGRNALIGLGIGAGGGLAVGAAVDLSRRGGSWDWFPNAGKEVFTPLGAIIGTVVGAVIPTGGWHEVYRAG